MHVPRADLDDVGDACDELERTLVQGSVTIGRPVYSRALARIPGPSADALEAYGVDRGL